MTPATVEGLSRLLGPEAVIREPGEVGRWSAGGASPEAVVFPRDPEELAAVLETASDRGWPVLAAGAGGWLDGGGPPDDVRLVISTRRMDAVAHYEPADLTLTAGAGLSLAELQRRAGENGQWLPQDPAGGGRGTLGAFVATGLPGPLVAGYGRPRDQVLGLTVVTGDGRVVRAGGRVVKNVAGYDLVRLLAGSWGTLGVITDATVRLFPRPERDVTHLYRATEPPELVGPARAVATAPVLPEAVELVWPRPDGRDGEGEGDVGGPGAVLAVRLLGSREAVVEKERIVADAVGRDPDRRLEGEGSSQLHRRLASEAPDGSLSLRMSLLPDRLDDLARTGRALAGRASARGLEARLAAHVTRGILRLEVGRPGDDEAVTEDWIGHLREVRERLRAHGGSLWAARGPAKLARELGSPRPEARVGRLLARLKDEFDPARILAPGRLAPGGDG